RSVSLIHAQLRSEILFFLFLQPIAQGSVRAGSFFVLFIFIRVTGKIHCFDYPSRGQHNRALEHVLKFSDIAQPGIVYEQPHHLLSHGAYTLACRYWMTMKKILNQEGNVYFSLTQRDKLDGNNVNSI